MRSDYCFVQGILTYRTSESSILIFGRIAILRYSEYCDILIEPFHNDDIMLCICNLQNSF